MLNKKEFITKEEIANNLNVRNVYEAEVLEVRAFTILFQIVNSDAKALAHIKDICVVRISDLRRIFQPGEIWPIVIKDYTAEEMEGYTKIHLTAAMNPIFGTRSDVMKHIGSVPMQLPICENKVDYNICIALSPNYTSLVEDNVCFNEKESVLASVAFMSERGKFRLNIHEETEECYKSRDELIKVLFNLYKKEIDELPEYIDVEAFRKEHLVLLPGNDTSKSCVKPDPELSMLIPKKCSVYPQKTISRITSDSFIRDVACNKKVMETLTIADKLFYYFTAEQLSKIADDKSISSNFMNQMKMSEVFSQIKLTSTDGKVNVYAPSKNARHLSLKIMKLKDQISIDSAEWILRHLSINKMLLKLYKEADHTIVDSVKRNWFFTSEDEKFRSLALIARDKLILDSVRSEDQVEVMVSKLSRMNRIFDRLNEDYTVYITGRTEEIEKLLHESLEAYSLQHLTIKTTNDIAFENDMVLNTVETKTPQKKTSFFGRINALIAAF